MNKRQRKKSFKKLLAGRKLTRNERRGSEKYLRKFSPFLFKLFEEVKRENKKAMQQMNDSINASFLTSASRKCSVNKIAESVGYPVKIWGTRTLEINK